MSLPLPSFVLSRLRPLADADQHNYARVLAWIDALPSSVVLEPCRPDIRGHDLASVREQVEDLQRQHATISDAPPPPHEFGTAVRACIERHAAPPDRVLHDGEIALHWRSPPTPWALLAWLSPNVVKSALQSEIVRQSTPLQRMLRRQRAHRLGMIEHDLERLCLIEEALLLRALAKGEVVERRDDAPPSAIVQVKIAREAMRAQRPHQRQSAEYARESRRQSREYQRAKATEMEAKEFVVTRVA